MRDRPRVLSTTALATGLRAPTATTIVIPRPAISNAPKILALLTPFVENITVIMLLNIHLIF